MSLERRFALSFALLLGAAACTEETPEPGNPPEPAADAGVPATDMGTTPPSDDGIVVRSTAPALKRKNGAQLTADLANALELSGDAVCTELGLYDCEEAHRIVLGGVEAYKLLITQPLDGVPVSAPIATERVALSACGARASADFAGTPVVFGPLASGEAGARGLAVDALYDRLLGRAPTAQERSLLAGFAPEASDQDFAQLACFVVATTLEHLFY